MAQTIRDARKHKGWTQDRLAQETGTTRRNVIRWEMGENIPSPRYRRILREVLGVDFSDLEEDADLAALENIVDAIRARLMRAVA